jgi:hypothetical protein
MGLKQKLLGAGRFLPVALLSVLVIGTVVGLNVDLTKTPGFKPNNGKADTTDHCRSDAGLGGKLPPFIERQYQTAAEEIKGRLDHERALYSLKLALVGAILAFFLKEVFSKGGSPIGEGKREGAEGNQGFERLRDSSLAAAFFWATVVGAAVVDLRIIYNAGFIETLGKWVRCQESIVLPAGVQGWETFLAGERWMQAPYAFVRVSNNVLTILLFIGTFAAFRPVYGLKREVANTCALGVFLSMALFGLVFFGMHFGSARQWIWGAGPVVGAVVAFVYLVCPHLLRPPAPR